MKALAQPIGVVSLERKHNLFECVEHEVTLLNGTKVTNEYIYVRAGQAIPTLTGIRVDPDGTGLVEDAFTAANISAEFIGVSTSAMALNEYGWALRKGCYDTGLAAGSAGVLRLLACNGSGVISATAVVETADGHVGFLTVDAVGIIGFSVGHSTATP